MYFNDASTFYHDSEPEYKKFTTAEEYAKNTKLISNKSYFSFSFVSIL